MNKKSFLAVAAGILFVIIVTTLVDIALHALGVYPPSKPMKHAMILGVAGVALAAIGAALTWNMGLGPRWYPLSLIVLAIPQSWAGAKAHELLTSRA